MAQQEKVRTPRMGLRVGALGARLRWDCRYVGDCYLAAQVEGMTLKVLRKFH